MNPQQALIRAIELTDEILQVLDDGAFERVPHLDLQRQTYIKQAFTASIEQIDLIRAHHLKNLNQQVVDRLNLFKQSIIGQQESLRNAATAARAYSACDSYPK